MDRDILRRYDTHEEAARYTGKFERHLSERISNWREKKLFRSLLEQIPGGGTVLDAPCGTGRLFPLLRERFDSIVEGDWSFGMLCKSRELLGAARRDPAGFVRLTALAMPFKDRAFDVVSSVRLSHHIREHEERLQHLREVLRIARRAALFTYFAHESVKARMRRAYRAIFPKKREKWTLRTDDVERTARECGFRLVRAAPISRLFSGHKYAVLLREG